MHNAALYEEISPASRLRILKEKNLKEDVMQNVMSISIRHTLISVGVIASAVLATFVAKDVHAVQSVGRAAMTLAWSITEQQPLTRHDGAYRVFGPSGETIGAASDPAIRSL